VGAQAQAAKPHGVTRKESERVRGKREEKREEEKEGG
jgi:hypothetical protein